MKQMGKIKLSKITPPISGAMIAIVAILCIVLASCSKNALGGQVMETCPPSIASLRPF